MLSAINLVAVCIQKVAYLAGRGDVQDTIEELARGIYMYIHNGNHNFVFKIMSVPVSILWLHLNHDSFTRQVFVKTLIRYSIHRHIIIENTTGKYAWRTHKTWNCAS